MNLVEQQELLSNGNFSGINTRSFSSFLMSTLKLNNLNKLYSQNYTKRNVEFLEAIIQELNIKFQLDDYEINNIPETGRFITISNHPFGGIDGMLLLKILSYKRLDFKLMGNYLLKRIEPLQDYILPVNPFEQGHNINSSIGGLKRAFHHLNEDKPLGIFPAGEVSSLSERVVQDKKWNSSAIKFLKHAESPIVPVYFHGNNSNLFHALGLINPILRTAKLPSELFNKRNKTIRIRIGKPVTVEEQQKFKDIDQFGRYLRAKTYALGSAIEVKSYYHKNLRKKSKQETISNGFSTSAIESEINSLKISNLILTQGKYRIYSATANDIPFVLNEIGRLREITFREIKEGTNRKTDLDEFDLYYEHLFIWDGENKKVVGSYRMGKGKEIMRLFGKKGLYTNTLFSYKSEMNPILENAIELGRSFIRKEYQKKAGTLFLLWKGILRYLLKNPDYRYLIGPVSISNCYSDLSKNLIIDFIKMNYYHPYTNFIKPRKKYRVKYKKVDHMVMLDKIDGSLKKLDDLIEEIEPDQYRTPILLKKYLKQNARIIGFNVDPRFNNTLDGLMILDLFEVPLTTIQGLSRDLNDTTIFERFYSQYFTDELAIAPQL